MLKQQRVDIAIESDPKHGHRAVMFIDGKVAEQSPWFEQEPMAMAWVKTLEDKIQHMKGLVMTQRLYDSRSKNGVLLK